MAEIAIGGGFQVDSQSLRDLAQIASGVGQNVAGLAAQIKSALALGVPGGLDIGTAIGTAADDWSARMTQLAGESTGIGANLNSNAASYDETEQSVLNSISGPGGYQVSPQ